MLLLIKILNINTIVHASSVFGDLRSKIKDQT